MADMGRLFDAFYIGGTKVGALFGEAVVFSNPVAGEDFRYFIKQHGGMLAKGRLLGVQFAALFTDDLYLTVSAHAIRLAMKLKEGFRAKGYPLLLHNGAGGRNCGIYCGEARKGLP